MADTRQDTPLTFLLPLIMAAYVLLTWYFADKQEATIRSLRQQLSQPCEVKR